MKKFFQFPAANLIGFACLCAPLLVPNSSMAAACGTGGVSYWTGLGSAGCTIGDKLYSDFTFDSITTGSFEIQQDPANDRYNFTGSGLMLGSPGGGYSYKVAVVGSGHYFDFFRGSMSSSDVPLPIATKTLTVGPGLTSLSSINPGTGIGTVVNWPANSKVTSATFTAHFMVDNANIGKIDVTTDSLWQKVPGPLPILGAGAAFGMSRKLRHRIKLTA